MQHDKHRLVFDCLPSLCIVRNAMMIESAEHLNPQDSVKEQKEEQKYRHTPDLLSGPPLKKRGEKKERIHNEPGLVIF